MEARRQALEQNLRRYLAFAGTSAAWFFVPVVVLFWQQNGLDLFEIFVLQGVFAGAIVLLEVPTGMVADRMGKRVSLIWAMAINSGAVVLYGLGYGFWSFLAAELLFALGMSLLSGAGSALLYDSLSALGREQEFERYEGRARGLQMGVVALGNLAGGLIGSVSYRATWWASLAAPLGGLLWALSLEEVQAPAGRGQSWREGLASYGALINQSLRFVWRQRLVRWQIVFWGVLTGSSTWLLWLYQPYMARCGLPVWAFGVAFTIFSLFAALMSQWAYRVEGVCGRWGTLLLLAALQIAPLLLMAEFVGAWSWLLILGHQAVRGIAGPVISARILSYTYADKRATVLSIGSMVGRLFFAASAPAVGWLARHSGQRITLLGQAGALTLILGALLIAHLFIPAKYSRVKEEVVARR